MAKWLMDPKQPCYLLDFPPETTLRDHVDAATGLRLLIVRGPYSFCAYLGVKADPSAVGLAEVEFRCHHGVTFQQWGREGSRWDAGWYWWGWDYGHFSDVVDRFSSLPQNLSTALRRVVTDVSDRLNSLALSGGISRKNWTVDEVFQDGIDTMVELRTALVQNELGRLLKQH